MTNYRFGDIILVPFPFTNQTASKKRPAVIISSTEYNQKRPDIVIMAVTSQVKTSSHTLSDTRILHWQKAGLLKPSIFKPILTTIEKSLVLRKLGCITHSDRNVLNKHLQSILGG